MQSYCIYHIVDFHQATRSWRCASVSLGKWNANIWANNYHWPQPFTIHHPGLSISIQLRPEKTQKKQHTTTTMGNFAQFSNRYTCEGSACRVYVCVLSVWTPVTGREMLSSRCCFFMRRKPEIFSMSIIAISMISLSHRIRASAHNVFSPIALLPSTSTDWLHLYTFHTSHSTWILLLFASRLLYHMYYMLLSVADVNLTFYRLTISSRISVWLWVFFCSSRFWSDISRDGHTFAFYFVFAHIKLIALSTSRIMMATFRSFFCPLIVRQTS